VNFVFCWAQRQWLWLVDGRCEMFPDALRLIRFERCLVLFVATQHEPDRLILAPEAVVTTAAAQSCADREKLDMPKGSRRRGATPALRKPARTAQAAALMTEAGMAKTGLAKSTSRHRAPPGREIAKPTIFDLYKHVRDIVSPLELELGYAELDELVSQLIEIMWTFVGVLARAHGYTDADWHAAERSFRQALEIPEGS
jgi:hypothetical protein